MPAVCGWKTIPKSQLAPGATVVHPSLKTGYVLPALIDVTSRSAVPVLVMVTTWAVVVSPASRVPKLREVAESVTIGPELGVFWAVATGAMTIKMTIKKRHE